MASDDLAKLGWITDRLPTEADADIDGDVRIPRKNGECPNGLYRWQNWDVVVPGQPWWSHEAAAAAASETGPFLRPFGLDPTALAGGDLEDLIIAAQAEQKRRQVAALNPGTNS
jgi:hypothetical protein